MVSLERGLVVFESGLTLPIDSMTDVFGDFTDNIYEACAVLVDDPRGVWWRIELKEFESRVLH